VAGRPNHSERCDLLAKRRKVETQPQLPKLFPYNAQNKTAWLPPWHSEAASMEKHVAIVIVHFRLLGYGRAIIVA
jgi:hypothetical protein